MLERDSQAAPVESLISEDRRQQQSRAEAELVSDETFRSAVFERYSMYFLGIVSIRKNDNAQASA